jgi:hypothetical protein
MQFIYDLEDSTEEKFNHLKNLIKEIARDNIQKEEIIFIMSKIYIISFSSIITNSINSEPDDELKTISILFKLIGKYIKSIDSYLSNVFDEKDIARAEFIDLKKIDFYNENAPTMKDINDIDGQNEIKRFLLTVENDNYEDFLAN